MQSLNRDLVLGATPQPFQHLETLVRSVVSSKPSRRLWDDEKNEQHRNQKDALEDGGDPPGKAVGVFRKGKVDPINKENAEVESGKLRADDWRCIVIACSIQS